MAIADAQEAKPFGPVTGHKVTDAGLFHLARDLLDESQAEAILTYCEEHLEQLDDQRSANSTKPVEEEA